MRRSVQAEGVSRYQATGFPGFDPAFFLLPGDIHGCINSRGISTQGGFVQKEILICDAGIEELVCIESYKRLCFEWFPQGCWNGIASPFCHQLLMVAECVDGGGPEFKFRRRREKKN